MKPIKEKKQVQSRGLGRGLGSLLGNTDVVGESYVEHRKEKSENQKKALSRIEPSNNQTKVDELGGGYLNRVFQMRIDHVFPNKKQPRKEFNKEALQSLANSIKEQGIIQPITCRKVKQNQYEIIAGERRWRAAQLAGLQEVPILLKEADLQKTLEWALIENIQREDLNVIEEAEAYKELMTRYSLTQQELSQKIGKERVSIANKLRLLKLNSYVREKLVEGTISMGHAKVLLSAETPEIQQEVCKQILKKKLSVRATEQLLATIGIDSEEQEVEIDVAENLIKGMVIDLQKSMGTKVRVNYKKGKGNLSLHFYSDEELDNIMYKLKTAWQNEEK